MRVRAGQCALPKTRGMKILLVTTLIVRAVSTHGQPSSDDPFCREFMSVANQARNGFRNLRGPDDGDGYFIPVFRFTGSHTCRIHEARYTFEYRCSWKYDANEWPTAVSSGRTLANGIAACYGIRAVEFPVERDSDSLNWHSLIVLPADPMSIEVKAWNIAADSTGGPLVSTDVTIRYKRHAMRQ